MLNFDEIDRKILRILQQDATLSVDALADRVHLSRNACWRRVKQMEEAGIIRAKVALIEPEAVGLGLSAFVFIKTGEHTPQWSEKFGRAVRDMPEIIGAYRMAGELDYVLRVRLANVKDYDAFYQRLTTRVAISDISASFVMDDIKETTALPV